MNESSVLTKVLMHKQHTNLSGWTNTHVSEAQENLKDKKHSSSKASLGWIQHFSPKEVRPLALSFKIIMFDE